MSERDEERRTVSDVADEYRPRYEAAATDEQRRAVVREWDAALEGAEPDHAEPEDLDGVLAQAMAAWQRQPAKRRRR